MQKETDSFGRELNEFDIVPEGWTRSTELFEGLPVEVVTGLIADIYQDDQTMRGLHTQNFRVRNKQSGLYFSPDFISEFEDRLEDLGVERVEKPEKPRRKIYANAAPKVVSRQRIKELELELGGLNIQRDKWEGSASCIGMDQDMFFPERGASTKKVKKICGSCAVNVSCLVYSAEVNEKYGIWGQTSERQRRFARKELEKGVPWPEVIVTILGEGALEEATQRYITLEEHRQEQRRTA